MSWAESLTEVFARAGCHGSVHASTVDGGREVGAGSDDPVAPASVVKVLVALEVETQVADGRLDPAARVRITAAERTRGPVGMSLFRDDAEVSVRDLVALMLTISDNVATDALLDRVGLDAVNATATRLGLASTQLKCDVRTLVDSIPTDAGYDGWAAFVPPRGHPRTPTTRPHSTSGWSRRPRCSPTARGARRRVT